MSMVKTELGAGLTDSATAAAAVDSHANDKNVRVDLEALIAELTELLGKEQWMKYAQSLSLFILGKLSRKELCHELDILFNQQQRQQQQQQQQQQLPSTRSALVKLHNSVLLGIFANSLKDTTGHDGNGGWGFGNHSSHPDSMRHKLRRVNKHNSQIENYKKIVMSLPTTDRNRLKNITKEAGKRGFVLCTVLQARLNSIPKIPVVINQDTLQRIKQNNLKTPLEWSQDIVNGFNAPLATDNYSLPDKDTLFLRMIGVSREHGLVGTVDASCVDLLMLALDHYLKNIVENAIDVVRYRERKYSNYYDLDGGETTVSAKDTSKSIVSLTNEDMYETFSIFPNLVDPTGAKYQLGNVGLHNDDELVEMQSSIDDLFPAEVKSNPYKNPTPPTTADEKNVGTRDELNWLIKDILKGSSS